MGAADSYRIRVSSHIGEWYLGRAETTYSGGPAGDIDDDHRDHSRLCSILSRYIFQRRRDTLSDLRSHRCDHTIGHPVHQYRRKENG